MSLTLLKLALRKFQLNTKTNKLYPPRINVKNFYDDSYGCGRNRLAQVHANFTKTVNYSSKMLIILVPSPPITTLHQGKKGFLNSQIR